MDVVIIANFCMDFSDNDNGRFSYLANMLCQKHDVEIVTSDFFHITKKKRENIPLHPYKITLIDEPGYNKNISLRRFFSHFQWGRNVNKYIKQRKKPDVIYCAVPSLTAPFLIARFCEKEHIKFVIDVQDLWPEAFQMVVNIPFISKAIFSPFKALADGIYRRADQVIAVSQTYVDRVLLPNKKCEDGLAVFLGTELHTFDENARMESKIKKPENEIWLGYCGTLGKSYDIKCVIDALAKLKDERIRFVVIGDGPAKSSFENYACEKKIEASFLGRVPYNEMCSILCECDIVVNPIIGTSVASIINKHADYAACGRAVINTQNSIEYRELISKYDMGLTVQSGDYLDFANKLAVLVNDTQLRKRMGVNARKCAEECFDRQFTYGSIVAKITGEKENGKSRSAYIGNESRKQ